MSALWSVAATRDSSTWVAGYGHGQPLAGGRYKSVLRVRIVDDRSAQLIESEQRERALSIVVEDAKIVGFVQVVEDYLKVAAITRFRDIQRQIIGKKSFDTLRFQFSKQCGSGNGIVGRKNDHWTASGE